VVFVAFPHAVQRAQFEQLGVDRECLPPFRGLLARVFGNRGPCGAPKTAPHTCKYAVFPRPTSDAAFPTACPRSRIRRRLAGPSRRRLPTFLYVALLLQLRDFAAQALQFLLGGLATTLPPHLLRRPPNFFFQACRSFSATLSPAATSATLRSPRLSSSRTASRLNSCWVPGWPARSSPLPTALLLGECGPGKPLRCRPRRCLSGRCLRASRPLHCAVCVELSAVRSSPRPPPASP